MGRRMNVSTEFTVLREKTVYLYVSGYWYYDAKKPDEEQVVIEKIQVDDARGNRGPWTDTLTSSETHNVKHMLAKSYEPDDPDEDTEPNGKLVNFIDS